MALPELSERTEKYLAEPDDNNINFKKYFSLVLSNWYWFAAAIFISVSIAYGINRWSEKLYTVYSTLLIKVDPNSDLTNIFPSSKSFGNQQNINNEIGILKSYSLNYQVIRELPDFHIEYIKVGKRGIVESRMYKSCPFIVEYDKPDSQYLNKNVNVQILSSQSYSLEIDGEKFKKNFGEKFTGSGFDFSLTLRNKDEFIYNPDNSNRYYFYFRNPSELANGFRRSLNVIPIMEDASILNLSVTGYVPEQEADYLNKLMEVYRKFGLLYKNQTSSQTIDFIEDQLETVADSLKKAEASLESFRLKNELISITSEGSVLQQKLSALDAELAKLSVQKMYYVYLRDYVKSKNDSSAIMSPSIMGIEDELLTGLINQLSELKIRRRALSMNLDESLEPLRLLQTEIATSYSSLEENIGNALRNIDNQLVQNHAGSDRIIKEITKLPTTERMMINIQRNYDINNTVYTYLLEKRAEAGIAKASNVPDSRIIDFAGPNSTSRIRPKEKQNLLMALMFGFLIPFLSIIMIDTLNNKIMDKKDIEKVTKVPIIGYINHSQVKHELPVFENPGSTLAESFRSVRTNMKYFLKDIRCPVISVTSTITAEGKTFISSNLATILALSGKRVLLVGLDLRKPRMNKIFGMSNETGLSNYLIGQEEFSNILLKTGIDHLWFVPSGPVPPNPAELIESEQMQQFIEKARSEFDYVIIDTPPVAVVTDALLASAFSDLYLFVIRQRYTSRNTLELVEELYRKGNLSKLCLVLNDINVSGYYGYGLRYGYALGYKYAYGHSYYGSYTKYHDPDSEGYFREI